MITSATAEAPRRIPAVGRKRSLARRLWLAVAVMLLPLLAAGAVGLISFRSVTVALETFRAETVEEGARIERVRDLLVLADDAGEAAFETGDPVQERAFADIGREIDAGFVHLATLSPAQERSLAETAEARWREASAALGSAAETPPGPGDAQLDPFHDLIDEAAAVLADVGTLNAEQVGREISALRGRERLQLLASLGALLIGALLGGLLARGLYRSVSTRLANLEEAAARFGADDLSHRIAVKGGEDELGRVGYAFNVMADRLQESRATLHHQALHDTLTGLPNRALFMEQLRVFLSRSRRRGTSVSVLFLDLDGFKDVNDTLGHLAGDELLVAVADRLKSVLRAEDVVARLGGDEFVIVLEDDADEAMHVARRVSRAFDEPWIVSAGVVSIGVSIGIATGSGDTRLDEFLRQADTAMYAAKTAGKGGCHVFHPELDVRAEETRSLRSELRRAVEQNEFVVFYQPIVNMQTGGIAGVEALLRWDHPERGLLTPSAFLSSAERSGDIIAIGRRVLREATRRVRAWQLEIPGAEELCLHVNLSARQLQHPGLADDVARALRTSALHPEDLVLEITETMLVRDAKAAEAELSRLKRLKVLLALDDFGTGFSSLSHLLRFPIDCIKIDRSFVSVMAVDERSSELVQALVNLGEALHLPVIAEGVEQAEHAELLTKMGCRQGQGNLFSGPLSGDELVDLLRRQGAFGPSTSPSRKGKAHQPASGVRIQIP